MNVGESIVLRIRAAARITAGVVVGSAGPVLVGAGGVGGDAVLASVVLWVVALFVGLVVGLQGVIVLLEGVVDSTD
ncbi:hypothetical protein HZS55_09325 [Halosimplex rubrum]|uniref:Uncharacterized protein n=1 Tax=Halosimplex rubrum TaxID=869889 RepID=A0A7D5NZN0_9EURY|nr:hypothetical protein [Halosimplex rubrum]QLH77483.1 hypothetical protein HZS55_09325 [Halosimplex rubrum]